MPQLQTVEELRMIPGPYEGEQPTTTLTLLVPSEIVQVGHAIVGNEALICLGLCVTFFVTAIVRAPPQDMAAILVMTALIVSRIHGIKSYQLALVAGVGFVLTTFTPQQLFCFGLAGLAGYIAVTEEGLLHYCSDRTIKEILYGSLTDAVDFVLETHREASESSGSSANPITALTAANRMLHRRGYAFASLPAPIRWALVPKEIREEYEAKRLVILSQPKEEDEGLLKLGMVKAVETVEDSVLSAFSKEVAWITERVCDLEEYLANHPVVWWAGKLAKRSKQTASTTFTSPTNETTASHKGRIGLLIAISSVVYLASASNKPSGLIYHRDFANMLPEP